MSKSLSILACTLFAGLILADVGSAAVAPSRGRVVGDREKSLRHVRKLLQQKRVRDGLDRLGMDRCEIEARLESLNDAELQMLSDRLDSVAVGRSAVGVIIVLLVIVALVLLIVWLAQRV